MRATLRAATLGLLVLAATPARAQELVVTTLSPARHSGASGTTAVSVTFDRPVNTATVNAANFRVFGRSSGTASGPITFSNADQTVRLTPTDPFAAGEVVTVNLANTLVAADASPIRSAGYAWQFTIVTALATRTFTELDEISNEIPPNDPMSQTRIYGAMASDLDNDGWTDLMTVNEISGDVRVTLNLADGSGLFDTSFLPAQTIGFEASPNEPGDFDHDGNVDAAISAAISNTVSIALGAGNGMFAITQVPVGTESHGVVVLDVDGDGDSDVVNANHTSNNLSLLVNNGMGVFGGASFFDDGVNGPWGLAAGDMNNDGIIDLVVASTDGEEVRTLLGNGNGTFTPAAVQNAGGPVWVVVLGDVDGDGNLDAATANSFDATGSVLLGNGDGTFDAPTLLASSAHTPSVDLGDLDGDGDLDLVLSVFAGNEWRMFTNNGMGTFALDQQFPATSNPSCSILLDFDNDGDLDMALTDEIADTIKLMQNDDGPVPPSTCPAAPSATCRDPFLAGKAFLLIKDRSPESADRLIWKWNVGSATTKEEFGDPLASESYRLCIYDAGALAMKTSANASSTLWKSTTPGFVYKNRNTSSDGAQNILLKAGADRKAKIIVKGKGANLELPALDDVIGPVVVQLHQSSGTVCWGATYSAPFLRQDAEMLKDRAD